MTLRWYAGDCPNPPTLVECPVPGWPNEDIEGRPQYTNTHFDDEGAAWANVRDNAEADVSINRRDVEQLTNALAKAKDILAKSIEALAVLEAKHRERWSLARAGSTNIELREEVGIEPSVAAVE
jgi:hypothetical protein